MWDKWSDWLRDGFKRSLPAGIAKKIVAPAAAAGLVSFGFLSMQPPSVPTTMMELLSEPCGIVCKTQQWVKRHPAISGAIAGGAAGSFVPGVGTVIGIATGATVGYTIGNDERAQEEHDEKAL